MTERVEFGSKAAADKWRNDHPDTLCSEDDRRLKTVALAESDTSERQLEAAREAAARSKAERGSEGGQIELTESEKDRIDFTETNVPHAQSVKGLMRRQGVDDWLAFYDTELTVDEHRPIAERAVREEGGDPGREDETTVEERIASSRPSLDAECDHAADVCQHGDPDACEFLRDECGLEDEEVDRIMSTEPTDFGDVDDDGEIDGPAAGALKRSWGGYKAAVSELDACLGDAAAEWNEAQAAARAINAIRADHGQEPLEFDRLQELHTTLVELVSAATDDCVECNADDLDDVLHQDDGLDDLREELFQSPGELPEAERGRRRRRGEELEDLEAERRDHGVDPSKHDPRITWRYEGEDALARAEARRATGEISSDMEVVRFSEPEHDELVQGLRWGERALDRSLPEIDGWDETRLSRFRRRAQRVRDVPMTPEQADRAADVMAEYALENHSTNPPAGLEGALAKLEDVASSADTAPVDDRARTDTFDVEDPRQGRETRHEAEQSQGGLEADTRDDPSRGAERDRGTGQQAQFADPGQETL
jgi:hypothetical protein